MARLKGLAKRARWPAIAYYVITNQRARRTTRIKHMGQSEGGSVEGAVDYVEAKFAQLVEASGLTDRELSGASLLELGPGDNVGLALRFLAAGAGRAVTLDKFSVPRDHEHEWAIYRSLIERLAPAERERAELAARAGRFDPGRLRVVEGLAVEEAARVFEPGSFDIVLSVAVLEHVYDPEASLAAMDRLLKPGGLLLHEIDFRDHGMFTAAGMHPLTFLTISPRVWRLMTRHSGRPNRRLIGFYRARVRALGYDVRLEVNDVLERELIPVIRPRLAEPFRSLPDEDLQAATAMLVARKPAGASPAAPR